LPGSLGASGCPKEYGCERPNKLGFIDVPKECSQGDYVLMDLKHGPATLPESVDVITEVPSVIPICSSPFSSQISIMEAKMGEGMVFNSSPTADARSSSPPIATVLAA